MVVGRAGKKPKISECNKVKKHHIWAFLELICNQLSLHLPPSCPYHQPRQGRGPSVHLWKPASFTCVAGTLGACASLSGAPPGFCLSKCALASLQAAAILALSAAGCCYRALAPYPDFCCFSNWLRSAYLGGDSRRLAVW